MADWLEQQGVVIVAMESTGVYWKPVFNVLEDRFPIVLANAQHLKKVPGRKTDVIDCQVDCQALTVRSAAKQFRATSARSDSCGT